MSTNNERNPDSKASRISSLLLIHPKLLNSNAKSKISKLVSTNSPASVQLLKAIDNSLIKKRCIPQEEPQAV